jgi:hypothetical protein
MMSARCSKMRMTRERLTQGASHAGLNWGLADAGGRRAGGESVTPLACRADFQSAAARVPSLRPLELPSDAKMPAGRWLKLGDTGSWKPAIRGGLWSVRSAFRPARSLGSTG